MSVRFLFLAGLALSHFATTPQRDSTSAFDLAIDIKIFAARKVSFDNDRFTDMRKLRRLRRVHDVASLGLAYRGTQAGILDSKSLCDLTGSQKNTGE